MASIRLIITKHAQEMMIERGIDEQQIRKTIQRGAKVKQTDGLMATYTYIQVAYKIRHGKYIIKTVKIN